MGIIYIRVHRYEYICIKKRGYHFESWRAKEGLEEAYVRRARERKVKGKTNNSILMKSI